MQLTCSHAFHANLPNWPTLAFIKQQSAKTQTNPYTNLCRHLHLQPHECACVISHAITMEPQFHSKVTMRPFVLTLLQLQLCHMNYKLQITNFTFHSESPSCWAANKASVCLSFDWQLAESKAIYTTHRHPNPVLTCAYSSAPLAFRNYMSTHAHTHARISNKYLCA